MKSTIYHLYPGKSAMRIVRIFISVLIILHSAERVFAEQEPVFTYEMSFANKGTEQGELNSPYGISVSSLGYIYIADTGNNRIEMFSDKGRFLKSVGGFGWADSQFDEPVSIWAEDGLHVYVADKNNHRIVHYDGNLNLVAIIEGDANDETEQFFRYPVSISRSNQGELFLIDSENNRVINVNIFDFQTRSFGGFDSAGKPLERPADIVIMNSEGIYVTDSKRREVVVYDYFGNYRDSFGSEFLENPAGLDVDERGLLYVCDTELSQIVVFNSRGRFISRLIHPAVSNPVDISFSGSKIYVLNGTKSGVSVFRVHY